MGRAHFDRESDSLLYLSVGSYRFLYVVIGLYWFLWPRFFPGKKRGWGYTNAVLSGFERYL